MKERLTKAADAALLSAGELRRALTEATRENPPVGMLIESMLTQMHELQREIDRLAGLI